MLHFKERNRSISNCAYGNTFGNDVKTYQAHQNATEIEQKCQEMLPVNLGLKVILFSVLFCIFWIFYKHEFNLDNENDHIARG